MDVEIRGVYDGICVHYNKETDTFTWRDIAIVNTTEEYRKEFEDNLRKQLKK